MSYPTHDDLRAFALNAGTISAGSDEHLDYRRIIVAACRQWEADTGYKPFVGTTQTRTFDAPVGRVLDLRGGLVAAPTSLTLNGSAQVNGTNYALYPLNAPTEGKPFTWIEFVGRQGGTRAAVSITGSFGYAAVCPDDVKLAILALACLMLSPTKAGSATGAVQKIRQDDVEISYAAISTTTAHYTAQQIQFDEQYKAAVKRYARVRLG